MQNITLKPPTLLRNTGNQEQAVACEAAWAGARIISEYFARGVTMRSKEGEQAYNLVSDADVQSEQIIASTIQARLPGHEILGEELNAGSTEAEHLWIVDPLDGTNNFAHGIPHFAVSIAYYRGGVAQCGVVVNPVRGDWYHAIRGEAAYHGNQSLSVRKATQLNEVMVGCGFYYDRGAMMRSTLAAVAEFFEQDIHGIRRFGTAALDLCQVAAGQFGVFFEYKLAPWDFAAARLILECAGGTITDARGNLLELRQSSILASNTALHKAALEITQRHHPA